MRIVSNTRERRLLPGVEGSGEEEEEQEAADDDDDDDDDDANDDDADADDGAFRSRRAHQCLLFRLKGPPSSLAAMAKTTQPADQMSAGKE